MSTRGNSIRTFAGLLVAVAIGFWTTPEASAQSISVIGQRVACQSGVAAGYACQEADLMSVLSLEDLGSTPTCGSGTRMCEVNDLWGWSDPDSGREFALVGREDGVAFVDVTNPLIPVYVGELFHNGSRPSAWRDVKTYERYAYIVAESTGGVGIQVFDLYDLYNPDAGPVYQPVFEYMGFGSAHNIGINEETGYAYVVGAGQSGTTCGGGLHMVSLADPVHPKFAGCFADATTGRASTGYTHDVQCVVYDGPDEDHTGKEICFGSNETAISIADVTDKSAPVALSTASYPDSRYVHQGWLTEDQRYFIQNDELDEASVSANIDHTRTLIWDVEDLDDPVLVTEYFAAGTSTDHNLYVKGDFVYQSNYIDGLHILDISDPAAPVEVASFDTHPEDLSRWDGTWSNYPFFRSGAVGVTSSVNGFFMIQPTAAGISTDVEEREMPDAYVLTEAYPNPFIDRFSITLEVPKRERLRVSLVDLLGRPVLDVFEGVVEAGAQHRITADLSTLPAVASGTYFYRIEGESFSSSRPVIRIR